MHHYTCPICQKQFSHVKNKRKYCSPACQHKSFERLKTLYICDLCKKQFTSEQYIAKYCSRECFNQRHTNPLWVSKQETKKDCLSCGISFNYIKTKKRKFCSLSCYINLINSSQEQLFRLKKYLDKYTKKSEGSCWEWQGTKNKSGYGVVGFKGKFIGAHRATWILAHGDNIGSADFICHICDNRSCVNIAHLWVGNAKENAIDMAKKGRSSGILSIEQVREIKKALEEGQSGYSLAKIYNVNKSTIYLIRRRLNWNHID